LSVMYLNSSLDWPTGCSGAARFFAVPFNSDVSFLLLQ
jgi:hypothetical protein